VTDGLLVVDKPAGWTSHDVVAWVRRLAGTRKVGHAGSLDPMATGVLVLGLGRATRLLGHLANTDKAYDATIRLGESTTTDDAEGEVVTRTDISALEGQAIRQAALQFLGELQQIPSSVSAIKVGGRRAYQRVRQGEPVQLEARPVRVTRFEVHGLRWSTKSADVDVSVVCSSGTYIRAIARDLGARLGVGGHLTALRRTRVGPFGLDHADTIDALSESLAVIDLAAAARAAFPVCRLDEAQARAVGFGTVLRRQALPAAGPVALLGPAGEFLALYEQDGPDARPVAVFVG
jgi:tRNA pseudouridine55 synthase